VVATEQGFYAADSGLEHALWLVVKANQSPASASKSLNYNSITASYNATASLTANFTVCGDAKGQVGTTLRRVTRSGVGCP
jgi:hypothetical protein